MLIVEGPDGGGKTTLINRLEDVFELPVAPRVVSKDTEAMVDLVKWTQENVAQGFQYTLYDRHRLISEPIYGSILRDRFEPGFDDPKWLHEMMYRLYRYVRPIIIYCVPPFEEVEANLIDDPDNAVVVNDIRKIWSLYMTKAVTDVAIYNRALFYDYTQPSPKGVMVEIQKILKEEGWRYSPNG